MSVILVHGFNVWDGGEKTVGRLRPYCISKGVEYRMWRYGWTFLIGTLMGNPNRAAWLAKDCKPGDVGIGHSNGCALLWRACWVKAVFRTLILINPALDREVAFPAHLDTIHVLHDPGDLAVRLASWIPGVRWGEMGAYGYLGNDERVFNHRFDWDGDVSIDEHSDIFRPPLLKRWGPRIVDWTRRPDSPPAAPGRQRTT